MPHIAFVAPHFLENTNRYVAAFAGLPGVTLSVISADPAKAMPEALRQRVTGHYQVNDVSDGAQLARAAQWLGRAHGRLDRLTGALEQLQVPMALAREAADIPGMTSEFARRFRDKDRMKAVLREHGVPVARSALVGSWGELQAFIGTVGFPVIVKPPAGLGTRGTHRVERQEDVEALKHAGAAPTRAQPLQAEQFVRAREFTCETVTINGQTAWRSGTRYFPSPLEVVETPWVQYCVLLPREVEAPWTDFAKVNEAALAALFGPNPGPMGTAITHMEWFLREDGAMLVNEVGARPPGVQIMPLNSLAYETDMVRDWAELIAFDRWTPKPRKWAAGAAFLRGQGGGGRVVSVQGLERAVELAGDTLVELKAPKVGQPRNASYEGEGHALVKSATTEGAKQALLAIIESVQVRYG